MSTESQLREEIAEHGRGLYDRAHAQGTSGNISARLEDGILVTPTNSCLGMIDPADVSKVDWQGRHIAGQKPSKEAFLHLLMYQQRPQDNAVIHLHATYSTAVSCCDGLDEADVLPPLTPYYVMKVGKLPLVPYFAPGDRELAEAVAASAKEHHAVLLANHGPVVSGPNLNVARHAFEELEETAKLFLLLQNLKTRPLTTDQVADLKRRK